MLIKICGLTNPDTAKQAAQSGVDYIGLTFSQVSPRWVDLNLAKEIKQAVESAEAKVIGVFIDETLDEIQAIIKELNLTIVQLHGDKEGYGDKERGNKVRSFYSALDKNLQFIYVYDGNPLPECLNPYKDLLLFEKCTPIDFGFRYFIAGGLTLDNITAKITQYKPHGIDLSSGVESVLRVKDLNKIRQLITLVKPKRYGKFGGQYIPELLMTPIKQLEQAYFTISQTPVFREEFVNILKNYAGRPTALTEVKQFAKAIGVNRVFLKREDLLHTGAHKINNAIGQCLLAKKMNKARIVAETGAGQHGLATATACAMFGLECVVYMGQIDVERQAPNVAKMRLLGAKVVAVKAGSATLKDAVNEALRDWAETFETTHYCLGSALGPYPFPQMVADFQSVIGQEVKTQFFEQVAANPDMVIACVGGGSNAMGIFSAYLEDKQVQLVGVEAGGLGSGLGNNAARFQEGSPGVLHGTYTYLLQTQTGQIVDTYSISAGLDYPAVGPGHANLFVTGRASYVVATDAEAIYAFQLLAKTEGIIPALESSHALAYLIKIAKELSPQANILINLSGRGDKDLPSLLSKELKHVTENS